MSLGRSHARTEPPQRPRFGPLREIPPDKVLKGLSAAAPGTTWTVDRFGDDGGYPNGGLWRVKAAATRGAGPSAAWVKRTSAAHLGDHRVWRCRATPDDPQWWGREAAFYESDLATSGWTPGVRAVHCYTIDDHDDCRDVWLESVDIPASVGVCERAATGLARWQMAHVNVSHSWLSEDWIPTHVRRHELDNERTLAHPGWSMAIERGLDPVLREVVKARVTDPVLVRSRLQQFPQVLTHGDFHHGNIGSVGDEAVIIDWAYVGWGPVGHDVGHLALNVEAGQNASVSDIWNVMQSAYCNALVTAGWPGDLATVRRSMAVSNVVRLGWTIDHFLRIAARLPDDTFASITTRLHFLAELQ